MARDSVDKTGRHRHPQPSPGQLPGTLQKQTDALVIISSYAEPKCSPCQFQCITWQGSTPHRQHCTVSAWCEATHLCWCPSPPCKALPGPRSARRPPSGRERWCAGTAARTRQLSQQFPVSGGNLSVHQSHNPQACQAARPARELLRGSPGVTPSAFIRLLKRYIA